MQVNQSLSATLPPRQAMPRLRWYLLVTAALSLAIISLANPLFRSLGFEYSALSALHLSITCGLLAAGSRIERARDLILLALPLTLLVALPLIISLCSILVIPNCMVEEGFVFYLEIVPLTAALSASFGATFSRLFERSRIARVLFLLFWLVTLITSLLPGYYNPQLFTYGWQYGFFPGIVWDEVIELGSGYWWFRAENIALAVLLFHASDGLALRRERREMGRLLWLILLGFEFLAVALLFAFRDDNRVTSSHERVERYLSSATSVDSATTLHFRGATMSELEMEQIRQEVLWSLHDIRERYGLTSRLPVHIYLYPSSESLYEYIGTRSASIAKPWRRELHIAAPNISSLKHELAHVLLGEVGPWPFDASWSTGLTEGSAMAVEAGYDGFRTVHEHAASILQMGYAKGVKGVMAFTGFAASNAGVSYVLSGSFSKYLIERYGRKPFLRAFNTLDYLEAYGKPIDSLEAEWKQFLAQYTKPLSEADSARVRYFFDRSSILFRPCLRKVGKLSRRASEAMKLHDWQRADSLYVEVLREAGGVSALRGRAVALIHQGRYADARRVLDTTTAADEIKQMPALELLKGDVALLNDDTSAAFRHYRRVLELKLSAQQWISGYVRNDLLALPDMAEPVKLLVLSFYNEDSELERSWRLRSIANEYDQSEDDWIFAVLGYLQSQALEDAGMGNEALLEASLAYAQTRIPIARGHGLNTNDSLFSYFLAKRAFRLGDSSVSPWDVPPTVGITDREERAEMTAKRTYLKRVGLEF